MRIRALIVRIIRQFGRDRRTLALLIMAPLLVLSLLYLVLGGSTTAPKLGIVNVPPPLTETLETLDAVIEHYDSADEAEAGLAGRQIDAYMTIKAGSPVIKLEGSDPARNRSVMLLMQQFAQQNAPGAAAGPAAPAFEYLHGGAEQTPFDSMGPVLIGLFAFFFVFLIAGVSFLKERTSGTLERLLATPLRRWEIVAGYIGGFGLFTGLQCVLIVLYCVHVLGLAMVGSIWLVLLVTLLLSVTALTLGAFLSAFANSEFQMIQFIPLVIVPQVFFSGLFDLESMTPWLKWLAQLMPLKYGADALRDVMIRGEGWSGIAANVFVLAGLSAVFMIANVLALRKHRKI